jgi:hypothetical protein
LLLSVALIEVDAVPQDGSNEKQETNVDKWTDAHASKSSPSQYQLLNSKY